MEEQLAQLQQELKDTRKVAEEALVIAKRAEEMVKSLQITGTELLVGSGSYASSSPTADGTIPVSYRGQRFNLLVDKV